MKQLLLLLKVQAYNYLGINRAIKSKDPKEKRKLTMTVVLHFVLLIYAAFIFHMYFKTLFDGFSATGGDELEVFTLLMAAGSIFVLLMAVYRTQGVLYGFGDYDFIMSMPVKHITVVVSRLLMLYIPNLGIIFFILLTACAAHIGSLGADFLLYLRLLLLALFLPAVPVVIGAGIGVLFAKIASKFKSGNAVKVVLSILFVIMIMALSMGFSFILSADPEALGRVGTGAAAGIRAYYPPADVFARAVAGDVMSLLIFCLGSAAVLYLLGALLSHNFKRLNTEASSSRKVVFSGVIPAAKKPAAALLRKEAKLFFSIPMYVMNTVFGLVILILGGIVLAIWQPETLFSVIDAEPFIKIIIAQYLPVIIAFSVNLCCITASSISVEGKGMWLVKAMPVSAKQVLGAKLLFSLIIMLPLSFIAVLMLSLALHLPALYMLPSLLAALACSVFTSVFGLVINLGHAMFDWVTPLTVVKQSTAMMICTFTGMGVTVAIGIITAFLGFIGTAAASVLLLGGAALMWFLMLRGADKKLQLLEV